MLQWAELDAPPISVLGNTVVSSQGYERLYIRPVFDWCNAFVTGSLLFVAPVRRQAAAGSCRVVLCSSQVSAGVLHCAVDCVVRAVFVTQTVSGMTTVICRPANGRLARKRDSERSSSLREDSDLQRDLCRRTSQEVSPRCKSCRALSPRTNTISTTTTSSAAVSTPVPRLCLCGGVPLPPIDLRLPDFADKDFIPSRLQSMWVATQEYPASPVSLASQSLCLDLDAISSEDSDAKPGDALCASPITVISVYSSDSDPDSSEVHSSAGSPSVPSSPTSSGASVCVVESLALPDTG